jgi:hypothetical protein
VAVVGHPTHFTVTICRGVHAEGAFSSVSKLNLPFVMQSSSVAERHLWQSDSSSFATVSMTNRATYTTASTA